MAATTAPVGPNGLSILMALRRRWPLVLVLGVPLAAAAAAAAWASVPPTPPTVRALLHIAGTKPSILFPNVSDGTGDIGAFRATQATLLKSRLVLNAALRQPDVAKLGLVRDNPDPLVWLDRGLRIGQMGSPEIMSVALAGEATEDLKAVVSAVINAYLQEIVHKMKSDRQGRLDELKQVQTRYEDLLRRKRKALRDLVENVGTNDKEALAIKQRLSQEQLAAVARELTETKSALRRFRLEQAAAPAADQISTVTRAEYEQYLAADPVMHRQSLEKRGLEELIDATLTEAVRGNQEPVVIGYRARLRELEAAMVRREKELRPSFETRLSDSLRADRDGRKRSAAGQEKYLMAMEKLLEGEAARLSSEGKSLNQGALDIESFRNDIEQAELMARQAAAEAEKLAVELRAPERVTLLEDAVVLPADPFGRKTQLAGAAAAAAFGLAAAAVGLWEWRKKKVHSAEQVSDELGVPVVGSVPARPSSGLRKAARLEAWEKIRLETVDATAAMLFTGGDGDPRAVLITSATSGEGKTSLAVQLARAVARTGRRTLLIDADLRRPAVGRLLDMPAGPGLCELLRGEADFERAVREGPTPNLYVLAAGCRGCGELDQLAAGRLGPIMERVRAEYDVAVIDSCPLLPVSDTLHLARRADAAVLSVMQDVSRLPLVEAALRKVRALGLPVLGAVVSGTKAAAGEYGYEYATAGRQAEPQGAGA